MRNLRLLPIMLTPLCLASCSGNGYVGTYIFQLGKASGTHFGVTAIISGEKYIDEGKEIGDCISLQFDMKGGESGTILDDLGLTDITIPAYYNIGDKAENGDYEMKIGFNVKDLISEDIREEFPEIETLLPSIDPSKTEKIIYSTINSSMMTFYIPVGGDDLIFQLYWYGIDFCQEDGHYVIKDSTPHKVGTHPKEEDIQEINDAGYKDNHENKEFRDFHNLTLKLNKQ